MKKWLLLFLLAAPLWGQIQFPYIVAPASAPSTCSAPNQLSYVASTQVLYGDNGSGGCAALNSGAGGGFPFILGSTSIAAGSTTTTVTGLNTTGNAATATAPQNTPTDYLPVVIDGSGAFVTSPTYYDVSRIPGATADVKLNACNAAVIAAGGPGICDATGLSPAQILAATWFVGNSAGVSVAFILPAYMAWSCTVTSGPCVQQYGGTTIRNENPACAQSSNCNVSVAAGATPTYIYATLPTSNSGQNYYKLDGLGFTNAQQATSTGIGVYLGGTGRTYDVSTWDHLNVLDSVDTYAVKGYNLCCQAKITSSTIQGNYGTGIPLYLLTDASGGNVAFVVEDSTIGHPGTGLPNIFISDTSSSHASTVTLRDDYLETTNVSSASAAIIKLDGCGTVNAENINFRAEGSSITTPGFSIANTNACILNGFGWAFTNGSGSFILPVEAVANSSLGTASLYTDAAGIVGLYSSTNANYVRSLHVASTDANDYSSGATFDSPANVARITAYGANSTTYGSIYLTGETSTGSAVNIVDCGGTTTAGTTSCASSYGFYPQSGSITLSPGTGIGGSFTTTGVAFPNTTTLFAKIYRGMCHMLWQQATAVSTVTFGIADSTAPTAMYVSSESSPGTYTAPYAAANITSTSTTAVSSALVPAATATTYATDIYVLLSATSTAQAVTIYVESGNGSDTVAIEPGSYCSWLP